MACVIYFSLYWYYEPSLLTGLAVVGICATLIDALVPWLCNILYPPDTWNGVKEKKLEEVSHHIAASHQSLNYSMREVRNFKKEHPFIVSRVELDW